VRSVLRVLGFWLATALLALGLVLLVYRSEGGRAVVGALPATWWDALRQAAGARSAEAMADVEFAVIAAACLVVAALLLTLGLWAWRTWFRRA